MNLKPLKGCFLESWKLFCFFICYLRLSFCLLIEDTQLIFYYFLKRQVRWWNYLLLGSLNIVFFLLFLFTLLRMLYSFIKPRWATLHKIFWNFSFKCYWCHNLVYCESHSSKLHLCNQFICIFDIGRIEYVLHYILILFWSKHLLTIYFKCKIWILKALISLSYPILTDKYMHLY